MRHKKKKEERRKKKLHSSSTNTKNLNFSKPTSSTDGKSLAPLLMFGPPSSDDIITFFGEVDRSTSELRRTVINDFTAKLKEAVAKLSVTVNFFDGYDSMTIIIQSRVDSDPRWAIANFNRPKPRFYYKKDRPLKYVQLDFVTDEEFFNYLRQTFPAYDGDPKENNIIQFIDPVKF